MDAFNFSRRLILPPVLCLDGCSPNMCMKIISFRRAKSCKIWRKGRVLEPNNFVVMAIVRQCGKMTQIHSCTSDKIFRMSISTQRSNAILLRLRISPATLLYHTLKFFLTNCVLIYIYKLNNILHIYCKFRMVYLSCNPFVCQWCIYHHLRTCI